MKCRLEDITLNIVDGVHGDCEPQDDSGYYFISVKDMDGDHIQYDGARQITPEAYHNAHKRTRLESGDVLFANTGDTIGKMLLATPTSVKLGQTTFQKSIALLKPNTDIVTVDYFYYVIMSNRLLLKKAAVGSGQKNLLLSDMRPFIVEIISDKVKQDEVVRYVKAIDRKITLNNAINAELEKTAKLLYDYWFVQLDFPDENGKPYRASGGVMEYNTQLKWDIPKGWKVGKVPDNDLCKLIGSGVDKFDSEKVYLSTSEVDGMEITDHSIMVDYDSRPARANMQPTLNSVWFAKMKDTLKHLLISDGAEDLVNDYLLSTGFAGLQCTADSIYYVWNYLNAGYFESKKNQIATGATQQAINDTDLEDFDIVIPNSNILKRYNAVVTPYYKLITRNKFQSKELSEIRDFLLPLLMNGQVTVKPEEAHR